MSYGELNIDKGLQHSEKVMVSAKGIAKSYKDVLALDNISFSVNKGELFGFIGPDGAGKTTLFRILTTLLLPDKGTATLNGLHYKKDYKKIRKILGYMPGRFSLYQDLSVEENLQFFATVFDTSIEENYDLIKDIYIQIEPFKDRKAGKLSGGMKQKLALSCALIHKPDILILDEPTTGVDAVSRNEFWDMLKKLITKDITILVSTPYMDEASLCDRIALMQNGQLLSTDTPSNIINDYNRELLSVSADDMYKLMQDIREYEQTHSVFLFGQKLHYTSKTANAGKKTLRAFLLSKKHKNLQIEPVKANIEDCFMELMKK